MILRFITIVQGAGQKFKQFFVSLNQQLAAYAIIIVIVVF